VEHVKVYFSVWLIINDRSWIVSVSFAVEQVNDPVWELDTVCIVVGVGHWESSLGSIVATHAAIRSRVQ
jgi:hypothetical protein